MPHHELANQAELDRLMTGWRCPYCSVGLRPGITWHIHVVPEFGWSAVYPDPENPGWTIVDRL